MEVANGLENLSEGISFFVEIRLLGEEEGEKVTLLGLFEYEDALRGGLFILLITRKGDVLSELEASDHVRVTQALESQPLVSKVFLLLAAGRRHSLQHH